MIRRAAGVAGICVVLAGIGSATAGPIDDLTGYWTGAGSIVLTNGSTERVKCAVVYKVSDGSTSIRQSLRCASADYTINGVAELRMQGAQVSGKWEEKTYSATGDVSGRYTGSNFVLTIQGASFTASMNVGLGSCKQSINIAPKGLEVRRVSMSLAKC